MTPIGVLIESTLKELSERTGIKWTAQLTSKGFIVYRKQTDEEYIASEYNRWRDSCCAIFNIGYETLDNDIRNGKNVSPRHWCWYMMTSISGVNIDSIVKLLNGQKNRTSVLHAIRKIHNFLYRKTPDRKSIEVYGKLVEYYQSLK
jgi:chromosomal replication initiation ATPase DnaA